MAGSFFFLSHLRRPKRAEGRGQQGRGRAGQGRAGQGREDGRGPPEGGAKMGDHLHGEGFGVSGLYFIRDQY